MSVSSIQIIPFKITKHLDHSFFLSNYFCLVIFTGSCVSFPRLRVRSYSLGKLGVKMRYS